MKPIRAIVIDNLYGDMDYYIMREIHQMRETLRREIGDEMDAVNRIRTQLQTRRFRLTNPTL